MNNKILIFVLFICVATAGLVFAQENKVTTNAVGNTVGNIIDNQQDIDDEGYGLDDTEYYGAENEEINDIANEEEPYDDEDINFEELLNEIEESELEEDEPGEEEAAVPQANAVKPEGNAAVQSTNETAK